MKTVESRQLPGRLKKDKHGRIVEDSGHRYGSPVDDDTLSEIVTRYNSHSALLEASRAALADLIGYRRAEAGRLGLTLPEAEKIAGELPSITQLQSAISLATNNATKE